MTAFADTSGMYASLDVADDGHPRALRGQEAVRDEPLITHGYVISETLSLVRRRLGSDATARFLEEFLPTLEVDHVDGPFFASCIAAYRSSVATSVSFVDRVSFEVMRRHGLTRAWALDADFVTAGFQLVA